ncbi:MAG: peroxiredoxin [Paludibacter sp.]|nr:peroxiredoxin [Paludibacter sp.]
MKNLFLILAIAVSCTQLWSQNNVRTSKVVNSNEDRNFRIPLIGEKAPSFTAVSTNGTIDFPEDFGRNWKILFSHPMDFTAVCSTEILELARMQDQFDKLGVKLLVVSTDKLETHIQWKKALEMLKLKNQDLVKIKFPIVSDENIAIAKQYGLIHSKAASNKCIRSVFIIDPQDIIQAIYYYPINVGRNTDELLRTITALQVTEKEKVFTPVNWKKGNDVLLRTPPMIDENNPSNELAGYYNPVWFLWYKKLN